MITTSAGLAEDAAGPVAKSKRSRQRRRSVGGNSPNRIASYVLFFVIAGAPFPFGSSSHSAIAFWCGMLGLGLVFASPRDLKRTHMLVLAGVAIIVTAYAFVLHEQLSASPWIAPLPPIWTSASNALALPITPSGSIVRDEPIYALGAPLAALLALSLGLIVGSNAESARRIFLVFAWSGAAYAVYGILALLTDPNALLWREKTAYVGNLTATFINRNTAATYLGSCALVWLLMLLQKVRGRLPRERIVWKKVPEYLITDTPKDLLLRFVMFFVCLAGLFMTGSRAGVTVSLLVIVISFVVFFRRDLPRGKSVFLALMGAGLAALFVLQILGGNIGHRFDVQGLADEGRLEAYRSMLKMIVDRPWFGFGLGTFPWAFPAYRSSDISMWGVWDIGHDTPLELAVEVGVPLTIVVVAGWTAGFTILVKAILAGSRRAIIPLSALGVSLIGIIHSLVDFSLQIPGYAIVASAILGAGLGQAGLPQSEVLPGRTRETST